MVEFKNNDKSCDIHSWGEFCEIIKGNGVQKADFVEEGFGCIHYGQIYTHYGPYTYSTNKFVSKATFDKARKASKGDVIMTDTSENVEDICKSVAYLGEDDIAVSNHALILKHNQNPKFLSYSTLTDCFLAQKRKVVVGVKVSGIKPEQLAKFKIYLPSLTEQQRIVEQLDTFTSSIENLKEQIAQRRKQYEYYRCRLLSTEKWKEIRIGELTKVFSCPRVFKDQWQNFGVPFWRSSDVMSYHNGVVNPRGEVFISESLYEELSSKSEKIKEGDVLVTGGGSIGIPYLKSDDSPLFVKDADLICIQKCSMIIPKFLYHYLLSTDFKLYLKKITHDATIAHYTINQIKDTPIPLPPLSEQQRIVSILDTFEASVRNLEQQLAQREKQYEYYRNKLLTFE